MNMEQLRRMKEDAGFIAALDQSGGSTPKALRLYGVEESSYHSEEEMFDLIHEMRTRIMTSPSFTSAHILGAILFEQTMRREVEGKASADYLWEVKHVVPFLKVDKGLEKEENGVQLMKPIPDLEQLLKDAVLHHVFGTKMRSVIKQANREGIKAIVKQQFEIAKIICDADLVPIIEPEIDIHMEHKAEAEQMLKEELLKELKTINKPVMFKLTIPTKENLYQELMEDAHTVRVVALSGGYSRDEANALLAKNHGMIASFSRALTEGLSIQQSEQEFNDLLLASVASIAEASAA